MHFTPEFVQPNHIDSDSFIILFTKNDIFLKKEIDKYHLPKYTEIKSSASKVFYLGLLDNKPLWVMDTTSTIPIKHNSNIENLTIRAAFNILLTDQVSLIGMAFQLLHWNRTTNYCSHCGEKLTLSKIERAKICNRCSTIYYPRINPCIIVSIRKDNQILLARAPRFPENMYSVIAGFVEIGETLETCVAREIKEEVGIEVKNIRYFKSQNWPFPNSLMVAFTADYHAGEINIDNHEIVDANWYSKETLPSIPDSYSVAGQLINAFLENE